MAFPHRTAPSTHLSRRSWTCRSDRRRRRPAGRGRDGRAGGADAAAVSAVGGGPMTVDSSPRQRPAAATPAAPPAPTPHIAREPFLTRTLAPFEVLGEEGLATHRAERRHDPPGGRHRVPRRPGRARDAPRRPAPTSRASASASRAGCAARSSRRPRRASFTQYARNPERTTSRSAGSAHRPRPELRLAVRPRPRPRPALRHDRGLPQLREARLHEPAPPPQRRHGLRAGRRAGQQAPPRHGLFAHPLQRQAVHGLGHRTRSGPATPSRWRGSRSARSYLETTRSILSLINANSPLVWDATMLGAARVYAEANQATLITPFILAGAMAPVTAAGVCAQTLAEALGRDGVRPARPAGRAGRPRHLRVVDLDAVGRADVRDAGAGPRPVRHGRARPPARRAVPLRRQPLRLEDRRRPGRLRDRPRRSSRRSSPASTSSSTPPAGSRAASRSATRSSSSTPTSAGWPRCS